MFTRTFTRTYNQFCPVASALDVVGDRWTLLIVRELLLGPRRFKDLVDGMPGISTNLLSERLKTLEQQGILARRVLPPPAGSTVYQLTPMGRELERVVLEFGKWGSRLLPKSLEGVALPSVASCALGMQAFFRPERAQDLNETYEWHLGDEVLQVRVQEGEIDVKYGEAAKPSAVFHADIPTYLGLFSKQLKPEEAIGGGLVKVEGDTDALSRFFEMVDVPNAQEQKARKRLERGFDLGTT